MMRKSITKSFTISVNIIWECPYCKSENTTEYDTSPYSEIAEELVEEMCTSCKEWVTLNFYENE